METPPTQNWKDDFQGIGEREPPDSWEMEYPDGPPAPQATIHKPWRGAATLIPKVIPVVSKKRSADCKQVTYCLTLPGTGLYFGNGLTDCRIVEPECPSTV